MYKVKHDDLVEVTNLLDSIIKLDSRIVIDASFIKLKTKIQKLSYKLKSNYTQIKPDYDKN